MNPLRYIRKRNMVGMAFDKFAQVANLTKSIRHEKTLVPAAITTTPTTGTGSPPTP